MFLKHISDSAYVHGAFEGIKAATAGLILVTVFSMGKMILKDRTTIMIALVSFALIVVFQVSAVWAIVFGGVTGYINYKIKGRTQ